jgi:DNA-binding CsgD family transcriptional regulator
MIRPAIVATLSGDLRHLVDGSSPAVGGGVELRLAADRPLGASMSPRVDSPGEGLDARPELPAAAARGRSGVDQLGPAAQELELRRGIEGGVVKDERRTPKGTPSLVADRGQVAGTKILDATRRGVSVESRRSAILDGLSRIWPGDAFEHGALVLFDRGSKRTLRVSSLNDAAAPLARGAFAYSSCALFRAGGEGRLARDAVAIPGVWLDLDIKGGAHKKQNLPTYEQALEFVASLPLRPTFILASGGGLYCWWLFAELWVFDSGAERQRAARVVAGWQALVCELAAGHGWHLDNTSSLAQVLRPEGSLNRKYSPAREVSCILDGGPLWNPSDIEEWIDVSGVPQGPKSKTPQCASEALPADELRAALTHIDCPATSYEQWRNVGFGLHHYSVGSDAGFALWDEWSSRDVARYEGTAALRKLWDGFGRSNAHRRPVTIRTVVALARLGGWRGALPDPSLVAPLPITAPTRPVVHNISESTSETCRIAQEYVPGERSLHIQAAPGAGKTSRVVQIALDRTSSCAHGWGAGVVIALPSRALVHEKARIARSASLAMQSPVPVRELLGRSSDPQSGWWCERHEQANINADIGRPACSRCPLRGSYELAPGQGRRHWVDGPCASQPGRYLHARKAALVPGGLLVTTHEALAHSFSEIDKERVLIIDDAGPMLGIDNSVGLRAIDIDSALNRVDQWREQTHTPPLVVGAELPQVYVADVVRAVLQALATRGRQRTERVEAAVRMFPEGVRSAILSNSIEPPRDEASGAEVWPWELDAPFQGADGAPTFTRLCIAIAFEVLVHGHAPVVERVDRRTVMAGGHDLLIHMPNRELIGRAKAGRVVWLSVAPVPSQVARALRIRCEVLHANPTSLELVVGELAVTRGDRGATRVIAFGPGSRTDDVPSVEDTITRDVARAMAKLPNFGAVLHKADREALGNPEWCRSYGAGHAGTDELADRAFLLVRRFMPPYSALALSACVLRRALGLEGDLRLPVSRRVVTVREARRWRPDLGVVPTTVPADLLARELLRAEECHNILNAIGRSRALSANSPRLVLVLNGRPFDALGATLKVEPLKDVLARLGVLGDVRLPECDARDAALADIRSKKAEAATKRRARLQHMVGANPGASIRELARRLKCSERTVGNDLAAIRGPVEDQLQDEFLRLRRALDNAAGSATRCIEISLLDELQHLAASDVAADLRQQCEPQIATRTIRSHLSDLRRALRNGAECLLPRRSDARLGLQLVIRAVARLLAQRRGAVETPRSRQARLTQAGGAA